MNRVTGKLTDDSKHQGLNDVLFRSNKGKPWINHVHSVNGEGNRISIPVYSYYSISYKYRDMDKIQPFDEIDIDTAEDKPAERKGKKYAMNLIKKPAGERKIKTTHVDDTYLADRLVNQLELDDNTYQLIMAKACNVFLNSFYKEIDVIIPMPSSSGFSLDFAEKLKQKIIDRDVSLETPEILTDVFVKGTPDDLEIDLDKALTILHSKIEDPEIRRTKQENKLFKLLKEIDRLKARYKKGEIGVVQAKNVLKRDLKFISGFVKVDPQFKDQLDDLIGGKTIVAVDDIMSTGSSLEDVYRITRNYTDIDNIVFLTLVKNQDS
jgi:hypothetical protein